MASSFVHLHVHSHFSLLDGLSKTEGLVTKAAEHDMPALALTDHGVMYGAVEFYQKAKKAGIKPIIGVEAYVARNGHTNKRANIDTRPYHLVLLAQNEEGYRNLLKLTSIAHIDGFYYKPRIDHDLLKKYGKGITALSACLASELSQAILSENTNGIEQTIQQHVQLFGKENYYLEVQHHAKIPEQAVVNKKIFELASHFDLPVVATVDAHYLNPDDNVAQDALVCIQTKKTVSDQDRLSMIEEDFSLKTPEQVAADWPDHPEVLENTLAVAERCDLELKFGEYVLPHFVVPEKKTPDSFLADLCEQGLQKRYGTKDVAADVRERLDYELGIIKKTGFAGYFLIVQDFINWAKDHDIVVGPGRGSAAGSLVAYLTGITNIDPLQYDLIFERFLNPERISMPDIDTDFADTRRDEVIEYVSEKYGHDHVAQIITFGTMAARAAIRDTGRVLGLPYAYCDKISKMIPMFTSLEDALKTIPELQEIQKEPDGRRLIEIAKRLEGCARHASTHACGVVVAPEPLDNYVPLQRSTQDDSEIVTQYEMKAIESLGLLKIDFLGLKNLTIIENALEILKKARGLDIDIDKLPLDDTKTYEMLQRAETTGVFQLESSGMRRYLKLLQPTELEDIIAMVALYRPGPMELIPDYIAGKHGTKDVTYLDPRLEPILGKTYGIALYQEQIMEIARKLAGFSYGEADVLRKAVGKKIKELLDEQSEKMISGMVNNGFDPKVAQQIWDYILPFARYGFNRSHAACYAMIAYQTAYLKAHYPAEFMASLLTADHGNLDRIAIEVESCRSHGIEVLPPDINESFSTFSVVYDTQEVKADKHSNTIRFGLQAVKGLGDNIIKHIIAERKENGAYESLEDFLTRVKTKDLNKKSIEALIKSGALDQFGERNLLLYNIEKILLYVKSHNQELDSQQASLFGLMATETSLPKLQLDQIEEATDKQRLQWEKEYLGLYVSAHPVQELMQVVGESVHRVEGILNSDTLTEHTPLKVVGVITSVKKIVTRKGQPMAFAKIEDTTSSIEVVIFPTIYQNNTELWEEDNLIAMQCSFSDKEGEKKLLCNVAHLVTEDTVREVVDSLDEVAYNTSINSRSRGAKYARRQFSAPAAPTTAPTTAPAPQSVVSGNAYIVVGSMIDQVVTERLKDIFQKHQGDHKACLVIKTEGGAKKIMTNYLIDTGAEVRLAIESLLGENSFIIEEAA